MVAFVLQMLLELSLKSLDLCPQVPQKTSSSTDTSYPKTPVSSSTSIRSTMTGGSSRTVVKWLVVPCFPAFILHVSLSSSDLWGDPGTFRPDRFLGPSGLLNKELTEKVLIFGMGKRRCLGDRLARLEMFIFLITLLHGRSIKNVPGQELDLSTDFGLTMKPRPYRITISSRF